MPLGSKKNIGLRAFFPELPHNMSNLDKAKIWVKRHNNNYFINWNQEQLQSVDTLLRPLTIITSELYKRHMNRSEYCRLVKLKYCMESDADWAKDFRQRLAIKPSEGGFRSLGEAKLHATELWRTYSELYDAQRARLYSTKISTTKSLAIRRVKSAHGISRRRTFSYPQPTATETYSMLSFPESSSTTGSELGLVSADNNVPVVDPDHGDITTNDFMMIKIEDDDEDFGIASGHNHRDSSSLIFPELDSLNMSISDKVAIIRDRKRCGYFLNWTVEQLAVIDPIVRPYCLIDDETYKKYIFSDEGQLSSAISTIYERTDGWAVELRLKIFASPEQGGFKSFHDFKIAVANLLRKHLKKHNDEETVTTSSRGESSLEPVTSQEEKTRNKSDISNILTNYAVNFNENKISVGAADSQRAREVENSQDKQISQEMNIDPCGSLEVTAVSLGDSDSNHSDVIPDSFSQRASEQNQSGFTVMSARDHFHQDAWNREENSIASVQLCQGRQLGSDMKRFSNLGPVQSPRLSKHRRPLAHDRQTSDFNRISPDSKNCTNESRLCKKLRTDNPNHQHESASSIEGLPITSNIHSNNSNNFDTFISLIWKMRSELTVKCQDTPALSWHDKLRPHLPLIRSQLGETYTLPSTVSECITDLVLVTLHHRLRSESKAIGCKEDLL
ncbi:hypothetical protein CHS0354_041850 [Potamilus streckersoni]|uniref:Uncharacterized protein n=1 Tax=Potamilus streckersoni TaxID=2493646 RepID=A0AAE0T1C3_9BIVA|nr:hypothetical protein CHS0354_041850 [Potamilus streckersoni]